MVTGVVHVLPYDTLVPAGTVFTLARLARNVIAGSRPSSADVPRIGAGVRPYIAIPVRTRSNLRSG